MTHSFLIPSVAMLCAHVMKSEVIGVSPYRAQVLINNLLTSTIIVNFLSNFLQETLFLLPMIILTVVIWMSNIFLVTTKFQLTIIPQDITKRN